MTRILGLACVALLVAASPALAARGFSYGVAAGEVTSKSAVLWAKANRSGRYTLQLSTTRRFRRPVVERVVRARAGNDNTVQAKVGRLAPETTYFYRFVRRRARSDVGRFRTAPGPRQNATVRFGWTGDTDFTPAPGQTRPYWNDGVIFRRMLRERNHFNLHLGDTTTRTARCPARSSRSR